MSILFGFFPGTQQRHEFIGHFVVLAHIASGAGNNDVLRAVRATFTEWNVVIDVIEFPYICLTVVAAALLCFVLTLDVGGGVRTRHAPLAGSTSCSILLSRCYTTFGFAILPIIFSRTSFISDVVFAGLRTVTFFVFSVILPAFDANCISIDFASTAVLCRNGLSVPCSPIFEILIVMLFVIFVVLSLTRRKFFSLLFVVQSIRSIALFSVFFIVFTLKQTTASATRGTQSASPAREITYRCWVPFAALRTASETLGLVEHLTPRPVLVRHGVYGQGSDETTFSGISLDRTTIIPQELRG